MNTSNGPVRPTPGNLNPLDDICLQLNIPNDPEWIAAFYDALYQLTYWMAWARDDAHTGKDIAVRWLKAINTIQLCREVQAPTGCPDPGEDYLIRQNPDNPCLIETSADGTNWCTLIDLTLCSTPTGQPGSGARQPLPDGGQECYHGAFHANEVWLVPTVVNAGDVLSFTNMQGAGSDGTLHWYCPSGSIYFAGACVGSLSFDGGDPAPAIYHMALIAKIGAVYYDLAAGPITVPGGIANEQVYIQVNDGTLAGNSGDYSLDACVTNNAAAEWESIMNFAISPYAFVNVPADDGGAWVAGTGWQGTDLVTVAPNCWYGIAIKKTFTAANITQIIAESEVTMGTDGTCCSLELVRYSPGRVSMASTPNANGHQTVTFNGPLSMTNFEINQAVGHTADNCATPPGGSLVFTKVTVRGTGPKPPEFP